MTKISTFVCEEVSTRRQQIIEKIYGNCTVEDHGYDTPCYVWQGGSTGSSGRGKNYPKMPLDGQSVRVHRVVFTHFEGYIPSKKQVDHKCGTTMCVRYEHLRKATQKQNCLYRDIKNGVVRRKRKRRAKRPARPTTENGALQSSPSVNGRTVAGEEASPAIGITYGAS